MGIYDAFPKFNISKKAITYAVAVFVTIVAIYFIYNALTAITTAEPFYTEFDKEALDLSDEQARSIVLSVYVTNITESTAMNSIVEIVPIDTKTLIVYPTQRTIETLGKGEKRRLDFTIRTNPNEKIYAGEYTLNVLVNVNGEFFGKSISLKVKTAD